MQNELLSTTEMATMTSAELRSFALLAPRQLSISCTRYAAAKDALAIGDKAQAAQFLEATKVAYKRSCEDEKGQMMRVAAVQAVVVEAGAAQDATSLAGKHVVKVAIGRKGAVWGADWARSR